MPNIEALKQLIEDMGLESAQKLICMFHEDALKRTQIIQDYVDNGGDIKTLLIQAHTLKGMCRTYGAMKAGDAAMDLQNACDDNDEVLIRKTALIALDVIPADVKASFHFMRTLDVKDS